MRAYEVVLATNVALCILSGVAVYVSGSLLGLLPLMLVSYPSGKIKSEKNDKDYSN